MSYVRLAKKPVVLPIMPLSGFNIAFMRQIFLSVKIIKILEKQ